MTPTPTPQQILELALNAGFSYDPQTNHLVAVDGYTEVTVTPGLKRFATLLLERYGQPQGQVAHTPVDPATETAINNALGIRQVISTAVASGVAQLSDEQLLSMVKGPISDYTESQAVQQEPVAWMYDWLAPGHDKPVCDWISQDKDEVLDQRNGYFNIRALYTHPAPAAVQEPLTREQVQRMWREFSPLIGGIFDLVAAVEKHHGITGRKA